MKHTAGVVMMKPFVAWSPFKCCQVELSSRLAQPLDEFCRGSSHQSLFAAQTSAVVASALSWNHCGDQGEDGEGQHAGISHARSR